MKKLVCMLGGYAPYFTPNSKIANNVLLELKDKYDITILAQQTHFGLSCEEMFDGIKVIRIADRNVMFHNFIASRINETSSGVKRLFWSLCLKLTQAVNYTGRLFRYQSYSRKYVRKLIRLLDSIEKKTPVDIIVPVSSPHENVIAGVRFKEKHKHCMLFPYKLDRFATGNSLYENSFIRKKRLPRHVETEKKTLRTADALFALPPIAKYYESDEFKGLSDKVIMTEHPLVKKLDTDVKKQNSDRIILTYAGSLDLTLRNPDTVFKIYEKAVRINSLYQFNLFSFGNCQQIIERHKKYLGDMLNDAGMISSGQVSKELAQSNILITIGNNSDEEVPSKLFEYISYGKPIVHFYFSEKDVYLAYLNKYKYALCLKIDDAKIDENAVMFNAFCTENCNKEISFDEIKRNYYSCTPEYTANQFTEEFEKNGDCSHSVIVAHPNQQHSLRLAYAMKRSGLLHTYITTAFYKQNSAFAKLLSEIPGMSFEKKVKRKMNPELDDSTKVFNRLAVLAFYLTLRYAYSLSCKLYFVLADRFGVKVAKYAIRNNCKVVVMYDYTAVACFNYLQKKAPGIIRVIDMSSIPAKDIDTIVGKEEAVGKAEYFKVNRLRYPAEYCELYESELHMADYFLSPSLYIDRMLCSHGVDVHSVLRAEYGVDLKDFIYHWKSVSEAEPVNFVFTGRVEGAKGIIYLLDACEELYGIRQDFCMNIIGPCNIDQRLLMKPYIRYHGFLNKDELIAVYWEMHVFVLPSLWEGKSLSALEAISSGMPLIVTDSTGVDDIVQGGKIGFVVPAGDSKQLADKMLWFIENKKQISDISEQTQGTVKDMSWSHYTEQAISAMNSILNHGASAVGVKL